MRSNPFEDEAIDADTKPHVRYDSTIYDVTEAETLARWLGNEEAMELFVRYLDDARQVSIDIMDGGLVTMANAEELVRHSAIRQMILNIKMMGDDIRKQLEAIARANDVE